MGALLIGGDDGCDCRQAGAGAQGWQACGGARPVAPGTALFVPAPASGTVYKRVETRRVNVPEAILDIKPWGNNLGVRLPAAVARAAHLSANQRVRITVEDGRVIITPHGQRALSLAERLALFDPAVHGGEAMATPRVGREKW